MSNCMSCAISIYYYSICIHPPYSKLQSHLPHASYLHVPEIEYAGHYVAQWRRFEHPVRVRVSINRV